MGEQIPKIYLELEKVIERKKVEFATLKKPPTMYFEEFRVMAMSILKLDDEVSRGPSGRSVPFLRPHFLHCTL